MLPQLEKHFVRTKQQMVLDVKTRTLVLQLMYIVLAKSRGSAVSRATAYMLDDQVVEVRVQKGSTIFLFIVRLDLVPPGLVYNGQKQLFSPGCLASRHSA
jgi:hypothetical protein